VSGYDVLAVILDEGHEASFKRVEKKDKKAKEVPIAEEVPDRCKKDGQEWPCDRIKQARAIPVGNALPPAKEVV
jgi:hypothetical protein